MGIQELEFNGIWDLNVCEVANGYLSPMGIQSFIKMVDGSDCLTWSNGIHLLKGNTMKVNCIIPIIHPNTSDSTKRYICNEICNILCCKILYRDTKKNIEGLTSCRIIVSRSE